MRIMRKRTIFSTLLLIVATMFSAFFAQSAEDAAKYGRLQEIQVPEQIAETGIKSVMGQE